MVSTYYKLLILLTIFCLLHVTLSARNKVTQPQQPIQQDPSTLLEYHRGPLLSGKISVNLIWYGKFTPSQKAIISDFVTSLSHKNNPPHSHHSQPSVAKWWNSIGRYYHVANLKASLLSLSLGEQITDDSYSLGKSLTNEHILQLASRGAKSNSVNVVLTSADVAVSEFCFNRCGTHGSSISTSSSKKSKSKFAYIWVGNSETQCPGQCAWPFHQPIYGPQSAPLVAPNNDVGLDGMVINLASLMAGTVTNPFGNGFYQGPKEAPLEVATACPGVYAKGAYPGYAGNLLVDETSGASYNANGVNGRKYLLPALYDPSTFSCSTLV